MKYVDLLREAGFDEPYDTCVNIRTRDFDYTLAFISFETDRQLCIFETDDVGREKLKIINKKYIESLEIVYEDDIDIFNGEEESKDKMFG